MARGGTRRGDGDGTAAPLGPARASLPALREAAAKCRACPLWERGTQTVFGEGPSRAEVLLVGEQPGNEEDLAVWLAAELRVVRPRAIACPGAAAAQALPGKGFEVTEHRGELVPPPLAPLVLATVHPSSILRAPDDETRRSELARFVADLERLAQALRAPPAPAPAPRAGLSPVQPRGSARRHVPPPRRRAAGVSRGTSR